MSFCFLIKIKSTFSETRFHRHVSNGIIQSRWTVSVDIMVYCNVYVVVKTPVHLSLHPPIGKTV